MPGPDVVVLGRLALDEAREALQQISEGDRSALLMGAVEGLPQEQIAAALGCSVAAVKVRIHRARLRLRAVIAHRSTP